MAVPRATPEEETAMILIGQVEREGDFISPVDQKLQSHLEFPHSAAGCPICRDLSEQVLLSVRLMKGTNDLSMICQHPTKHSV